jgi:hypothetical protein
MLEGFEASRLPVGMVPIGTGTASYPAGRLGGKAVQITENGSGSNAIGLQYDLGINLSTIVFGHAVAGNATMWAVGANAIVLSEAATAHLILRRTATGTVEVRNGAGTVVLLTSTDVIGTSGWNYVELKAVIHDTTGSLSLAIDGGTPVTASGIDTRNGGAAGVINRITWNGGVTNGGTMFVDDMFIDDSTLRGECRVETLRPSGNGASSTMVGSDGNSVDNYVHVDDDATTADYVGSATVGAKDTYAMTDLASTAGTVLAMQTEVLASKSDAGALPGPLQIVERSTGGTERVETVATVLATPAFEYKQGSIRTTDANGDALTIALVNASQVGVKIG